MSLLYNFERGCRFGISESINQLELYLEGYADFWDFFDTLSFNFGLIYDSILTGEQSYNNGKYFMGGYSVGRTIFFLFFQT
jgi:hypothetical protein